MKPAGQISGFFDLQAVDDNFSFVADVSESIDHVSKTFFAYFFFHIIFSILKLLSDNKFLCFMPFLLVLLFHNLNKNNIIFKKKKKKGKEDNSVLTIRYFVFSRFQGAWVLFYRDRLVRISISHCTNL